MEFLQLLPFLCLLLFTLLTQFSNAQPTFYSSLENDNYYAVPYAPAPITDYRLSRLRRGYYYVDDGYITAVSAEVVGKQPTAASTAARRLDDESNKRSDSSDTRYTPLLRYKQTKHKKLFVPNLYG